MPAGRADLADTATFLALARQRSFRRAGRELGVSASAVSHALKAMEARLGVRLLNRTSRSVTLSAAGEELFAALDGPVSAIGSAYDSLNRYRVMGEIMGRIRLNVLEHASTLLIAPVLPIFAERHPGVEVDVRVTNDMLDVVAAGADAGIRYGGTVPEDMVAQCLSADLRWVVVAAPAYLNRYGVPAHPEDLRAHRCIRVRLGDDRLYHWEFERGGDRVEIDVPGPVTIDNTQFGLTLAAAGGGCAYLPEACVAPAVAQGALQIILSDWAPNGPGFHVYYPSRRQLPIGLRLLIDLIREVAPLGTRS